MIAIKRVYLTSVLADVAMCGHVVLQELDLGKAVPAHSAHMFLLLVCYIEPVCQVLSLPVL